jgi:hypothetical protein
MQGLRMAGTAGGGTGELSMPVPGVTTANLGKRIYPNEQSPLAGRRAY